jgi:hypothetical protein
MGIRREAQGCHVFVSYEVDKLEKAVKTAEAGVEIEEFFFLEDSFTRGHVEEREGEVIAETSEILGVWGKLGLTASSRCRDVRDAGLLLMIDTRSC